MTHILLLLPPNCVLKRFHCTLLLDAQGKPNYARELFLEAWPPRVESDLDEVLLGGAA